MKHISANEQNEFNAQLHTIEAGNPVGDYFGFPEVQAEILAEQERVNSYGFGSEGEVNGAVLETIKAAETIREIMPATPCERAPLLSKEFKLPIYLKREDLTPVKSFKIRGAYNMLSRLASESDAKRVLAASAGNHAQGVALSAQKLGLDATIVMPVTTPEIKVNAVTQLGAEVVLEGDSYSEAYEKSQEMASSSDKVFVHPFDNLDVIAGQGTVALELLDQNPATTHVFVPVGGGGLLAGVAQFIKEVRPDVAIIGVEPNESNAMQQSLEAGRPVELEHVGIFADGVAVKRVGDLTFELARLHVDDMISVTNDEISAAIADFYKETRSLLEPAGALSIAGLRKYFDEGLLMGGDQNATVICSGANMEFPKLRYIAESYEIGRRKEALFAIKLPETPGTLLRLCEEVVNGHNITELKYRKSSGEEAVILVGFGMANERDKAAFKCKLRDNQYPYSDLTDDDFAKLHARNMVGGKSHAASNETVYSVEFPEKAGALTDFLEHVNGCGNISMFHYRFKGGDTAEVIIGFEQADTGKLDEVLKHSARSFNIVQSEAVQLFL